MENKVVVGVRDEIDITFAQSECIKMAQSIDFTPTDLAKISTLVQELATNILKYAGKGKMSFTQIEEKGKAGLLIEAIDRGPAIADIEKALTDRYSSGGTLGLGLPGVKRIADDLDIQSEPGKGTHIKATYLVRK
jgi:serine/threonine-protein kinase RsbT